MKNIPVVTRRSGFNVVGDSKSPKPKESNWKNIGYAVVIVIVVSFFSLKNREDKEEQDRVNDYNRRVNNYNDGLRSDINSYNSRVDSYYSSLSYQLQNQQRAVDNYNDRVDRYNQELQRRR